jgi:hypothetical protein
MPRTLLLGLLALSMAVGCGSKDGNRSKDDRPDIPTTLKQPPGMDSEGGRKGAPKNPKAPDQSGGRSSSDG